MSLQAALTLFLEEYPGARTRPFAGDDVAKFVREDVPEVISAHLSNPRFLVTGSAGKGNWAQVPWVAILDTLITDTAQDGFYIVYLVKEDFSGVFLSLNQGVTTVRERYGADGKKALRARANDFLARLGNLPSGFTGGEIDLAVESAAALGAFYEAGSICAKFYGRSAIRSDAELFTDLDALAEAYLVLSSKEAPSSKSIDREDDETDFEDLTKIRLHKRIERNQRLARKVKAKKGYRCEACGFSYSQKYRELDVDYIEAHHLVPLSELTVGKVRLDPEKDFAVLCANCHRMIHRSSFISDLAAFKAHHVLTIPATA